MSGHIKTLMILMLLLPGLIFSQGYVQSVGETGNVNWTQHVIRCTGIGAPNPDLPLQAQRAAALRAARADALRRILETVKGVQLTSETLVENHMLLNDAINMRVQGAIRGFREVDVRYMSTNDVEVDVEVPITGIILDALLPDRTQFGGGVLMAGGQLLCPTCRQPWPDHKDVPHNINLLRSGGQTDLLVTDAVFTGLVVDAQGLGVRPAMAPKILDENGNEIYGSKFVSREYAVNIGMAGYEKDISRAARNERVADNPLVIKAVDTSGPNKSDIIISMDDAARVHNAASNNKFLNYCKVMIILD